MEVIPCKLYDKVKKGICKAVNLPISCKGNQWYCDYPRERREKENGEDSTGVKQEGAEHKKKSDAVSLF